MTERSHVGMAAALGAFSGMLMVLSIQPSWWWLGALGGAIVGYIAYDPRKVLEAIPRAIEDSGKRAMAVWTWLSSPHPFWLWTVVVWISGCLLGLYLEQVTPARNRYEFWLFMVIGPAILAFLADAMLFFLALAGSSNHWLGWKIYWTPSEWFSIPDSPFGRKKTYSEIRKGRSPRPLSYRLIYGLALWGIVVTVVIMLENVRDTIRGLPRFLWNLILRIHRDERLVGALDAWIGVVITWVCLQSGWGKEHIAPTAKIIALMAAPGIGGLIAMYIHYPMYQWMRWRFQPAT
ncbi:MAG: hypothetical protein M3Q73_01520 [bacterium]|nr:hypothetical protein [bacterium]